MSKRMTTIFYTFDLAFGSGFSDHDTNWTTFLYHLELQQQGRTNSWFMELEKLNARYPWRRHLYKTKNQISCVVWNFVRRKKIQNLLSINLDIIADSATLWEEKFSFGPFTMPSSL
ncbi:uncharacterized protein LOC143250390 isoform X2 [Tachypleus tridentatus]|uniref:uncharacterized protein LOC143250390 isoform X2 n=1 Tax=Tachypleus tridentatus TaxID=6853 RepID=UPI003FD4B8F8